MRILILEDNEAKLNNIKKIIRGFVPENEIETSTTIIDAKRKLKMESYNLFFVDLNVPKRGGEEIVENSGLLLIKELQSLSSGCKLPKEICIISRYEKLLEEYSNEINIAQVKAICYNETSTIWEAQLNKIIRETLNANPEVPENIIFSLHGFNSRGEWQNTLAQVITSNNKRNIYSPWDYGNAIIAFFTTIGRNEIIKSFHKFYDDTLQKYGGDSNIKICVVAHSFGTFILQQTLMRYPEIKFHKIILLGSVIKEEFNWDDIKEKVGEILCYKGGQDSALKMAPLIWGLGKAGKNGFTREFSYLKYSNHIHSEHSDMFGAKHMKESWMKFFLDNSNKS